MPRFQGEDWDVIWRAVEISTTVLFTIEYLLRLWVPFKKCAPSPDPKKSRLQGRVLGGQGG
eukprot:2929266-Amphidinium_carterae.1